MLVIAVDAATFALLAISYDELGRVDQSRELFRRYMEIEPDAEERYLTAARLHLARGHAVRVGLVQKYAYGELTWPREEVVAASFGSDDGAAVWINGERVGYSEGSRTDAEFDITEFVDDGVPTIHPDRSGDPYFYQHVGRTAARPGATDIVETAAYLSRSERGSTSLVRSPWAIASACPAISCR